MMKEFLIIIMIIGMCACATVPPTAEQLKNADYGPYPENYKELITSHISETLIDPNSAQFSNWKGPSKGWWSQYRDTYMFGYRVCVFVNAKNRMGGYTGKKLFFAFIKDKRIVSQDGLDYKEGTMGEQWVYEKCKGL